MGGLEVRNLGGDGHQEAPLERPHERHARLRLLEQKRAVPAKRGRGFVF